jgi:hypothetical protein
VNAQPATATAQATKIPAESRAPLPDPGSPRIESRALADSTEPADAQDITEPADAAEATEKTEAAEPIDPIEANEPTDPIDSAEPLDAIER